MVIYVISWAVLVKITEFKRKKIRHGETYSTAADLFTGNNILNVTVVNVRQCKRKAESDERKHGANQYINNK